MGLSLWRAAARCCVLGMLILAVSESTSAQNCTEHGTNVTACEADTWCVVNESCGPLLAKCLLDTQLLCNLEPGCAWDPAEGCYLESHDCLTRLNESDCNASLLCYWETSCVDTNTTTPTSSTMSPGSTTAGPPGVTTTATGGAGTNGDKHDGGDNNDVGNVTPPLASQPGTTTGSPITTGDSTGASSSTDVGAIAGGVAAAALLLVLVILAVVLVRRKRKQREDDVEVDADVQTI